MIPHDDIKASAALVPATIEAAPAAPLAPALPEPVVNLIESRQPTARRTIVLFQPVAPPVAPFMDVDQAAAILMGTDNGNSRDYFTLCEDMLMSDNHFQCEMGKRKLAVLGDQLNISPANPKSTDDVVAAALVRDQIDTLPSWLDACNALLDSTLWPVAVVEKVYRRSSRRGLAFDMGQLIRVSPRLFSYETQNLRLHDVSPDGFILGTTQAPDPLRYVIHRGHLLTAPDQRGGPIRSLIFWWLFKNMDRNWWAQFLDRYGSPFMVGKYDAADDDSRIVLQNAFSVASRLGGLVISKETDAEIKEAGTKSAGEAFEGFHRVANEEISKLIVGQVTSAGAHSTGMNSGIGEAQAQVRNDIRQFDGLTLGRTLVQQLWHPWLRHNGLFGRIIIKFGAEEAEDITKTSSAIAALANAGLELTDEAIVDLGERFGLTFRRKVAPILPGSPAPALPPRANTLLSLRAGIPAGDQAELLDAANLQIAREGSAGLSQALGGTAADLRTLALRASDRHDLEIRLRMYFADLPVGRIAPHFEHALTAFVAQGASAAAVPEG